MKNGAELILESIESGETVRAKWTPELDAQLSKAADSVGTSDAFNIYGGDRWTVVLTKEPTK
jgi:hypothetical protein